MCSEGLLIHPQTLILIHHTSAAEVNASISDDGEGQWTKIGVSVVFCSITRNLYLERVGSFIVGWMFFNLYTLVNYIITTQLWSHIPPALECISTLIEIEL